MKGIKFGKLKELKYIYTNSWNEFNQLVGEYEENHTILDSNEIGVLFYNKEEHSKVVVYKPNKKDFYNKGGDVNV